MLRWHTTDEPTRALTFQDLETGRCTPVPIALGAAATPLSAVAVSDDGTLVVGAQGTVVSVAPL